MAKCRNLKFYGAVGLLISSLTLGGCGNKQERILNNEFILNDIVAHYIDSSDAIIINEENQNGFNAKTYRDLLEIYGNDINKFSLNNAKFFNFECLDNISIKELSISIPNSEFNFNSLMSIKGLEKLEIAVNESANMESIFNYLNNNDLSGVDLTIKLLDISSCLSFTEQLKNNTINAASVTVSSEYTDFYKYIYNLRTPDLKISRVINNPGCGDIEMQLSKVTERLYYEYINNGQDTTLTINNLDISSNNNEVLVSIEKSNSLTLVIPENAKISAPEGTTLETAESNILKLKEE